MKRGMLSSIIEEKSRRQTRGITLEQIHRSLVDQVENENIVCSCPRFKEDCEGFGSEDWCGLDEFLVELD